MDTKIQEFKDFLECKFSNLKDIKHTFEFCSRDNNSKVNLVDNKSHTINFDKLTEWYLIPKPKSADSLSFNEETIYLIEFKSGDQTSPLPKLNKLIENVRDKINDSDSTLSLLYKEAFEDDSRLDQIFCLVVDSKKMGIDSLSSVLAKLSSKNNINKSEKEKLLFEKLYPDLKDGIKQPNNYKNIEIWYSDLFDRYLSLNRIMDVCTIN